MIAVGLAQNTASVYRLDRKRMAIGYVNRRIMIVCIYYRTNVGRNKHRKIVVDEYTLKWLQGLKET